MGNFSRDTFKLTNALYQLLAGEPVADPRHYVGVRMQQGVPLLDADWNELEDIRHLELRAILQFYIGSGVPAGNQGFQITASGVDNDFAINGGVILVDGLPVINLAVTTYSTQPVTVALPPLITPGGSDRTDVVYLDVWHEEVNGVGAGNVDPRLVNGLIGVETAVRIGRFWQVRVLENATDLSGLVLQTDHHYTMLARLNRTAGVAAIRDSMIVDRRKTGITLAEHLKVPIDLRRGLEVLTVERFGQMLRGLRTSLFARLRGNLLPYTTVSAKDELILLMALQELMNLAQTGEVQTASLNMDNANALNLMSELYNAQNEWLTVLNDLGNVGGVAQEFIDDYADYLEGESAELIKGLKPALDREDLIAAVMAQEDLNLWLTAPTGNLPEGSADAFYVAVIPFEVLTAGQSYDFTYDILTDFTSPMPQEEFTIQVTLPAAFGTAVVDQPTLTFAPPGGETTITVTVIPTGGLVTANLDVTAIAVRNATLRSSQLPITLTLGQLPPVAAFFFYADLRLNLDGRLELTQNHLNRVQGRDILFRLRNHSAIENRTFEVTGQIIPNVADPTGWGPLAPIPLPPFTVAPGVDSDVFIKVHGPQVPAPPPPVGVTGNIVATATLTAVDGNPPIDPPAPVTITIPFIVV